MPTLSVTVGERALTVKPLSLKGMRVMLDVQPALERVGAGAASAKDLDALIDLFHVALSRGNKDVSREWLNEELDSENMTSVLDAIMVASGFSKAAPGEAGSP